MQSMQATSSVQKKSYLACKHDSREPCTPKGFGAPKGKSGLVVKNGREEGSGRRRDCILTAALVGAPTVLAIFLKFATVVHLQKL
jgi:hypothetical protein